MPHAEFRGRLRLALNSGSDSTHSLEATLGDVSVLTIPDGGTDFELSHETRFSWQIDLPDLLAHLFVGHRFDTRDLRHTNITDQTNQHHGMAGILLKLGPQTPGQHHALTRWWLTVGWRVEVVAEGNAPSTRPMVLHAAVSVPSALGGAVYLHATFSGILRNSLPTIVYEPTVADGLRFGPEFSTERRLWTPSARVGIGFDLL
ncbi:MAG: hypothetical protein ACI9OJ_004347 [Myxococcota bacterium]